MSTNSAQIPTGQPFILQNNPDPPKTPTAVSGSSKGGKEAEPIKSADTFQTITAEVQPQPEVKKAGVEVIKDSIELPPDIKSLGVSPAGASVPMTVAASIPQVVLPIPDNIVVAGLHTKVGNAVRWMAVWCIKKLKKAHVALKVIHGKIVRVRIK